MLGANRARFRRLGRHFPEIKNNVILKFLFYQTIGPSFNITFSKFQVIWVISLGVNELFVQKYLPGNGTKNSKICL